MNKKHRIEEITQSIENEIEKMIQEEDKKFFTFVLNMYESQRKSFSYFQTLLEYIKIRRFYLQQTEKSEVI